LTAVGHGVSGVLREAEQRSLQTGSIAEHLSSIGFIGDHQLDRWAELPAQDPIKTRDEPTHG
jgi:hypothetical protein